MTGKGRKKSKSKTTKGKKRFAGEFGRLTVIPIDTKIVYALYNW
jgi:hypothetical protein